VDELLKNPTVIGLLAVAVVAFWREWVVPGTRYEKVIAERDRFIDIAIRARDITAKSLDVAKSLKG